MIELLKKLVSFKTVAENPEEIKKGFKYIASLFDAKIFKVQAIEKNGRYSLLVLFKGKDAAQPKILLNGHFDVVPAENENQYQLKVKGSKAFGRGALDMKGMVATIIEIMQALGKRKSPPNVAFLLNGDEEAGGENGAGYCARELGIKPQFFLCADGHDEKTFKLTTKEKGVLWLEIIAKGKAAHGAYLWLGENAIDKLMNAIQKIKGFVGKIEPEAWKSTLNFGIIETDNKTPNKVPAFARAVLDIRFTEKLAKTPNELLKKIKALAPNGIRIRALEKGSLMFIKKDKALLQQFKNAAEGVLGFKIKFSFAHGATDARYFAEIGVPCAVFGAIGGNMHTAGEWVDLKSLETNKQILLKFLQGQ